ncbi:hypothetical protein [Cellulomonas chengniuliangii]|uniref:hypothetical protein n=1 Tax=Cellulomonas chengniuliangii TaxID=2968084 RepID=UPI001D0DF016|nr:hypothetical protein [Cellulomonas chengniuliangii]MCC2316747.1 hypothetical protein [Cellulomonas chengniuliangii]
MSTREQSAVTHEQADPVEPAPVMAVPAPAAAGNAKVRMLALGLWGVVGGLLVYGVVQTVMKAGALFGG